MRTTSIDTSTQLYAVIGHPVKHSKSPPLFNSIFNKHGINVVYLAFENANVKELLTSMRSLDIKGFSITIPHKEMAMEYVDEIDPLAKELGCINTVIYQDGKIKGYNFDGNGAIESLNLQCEDWLKKKILIIGNGGAAKGIAITAAYHYKHPHVDILCRDRQKGESISQKIKSYSTSDFQYQSDILILSDGIDAQLEKYDIVINTTPLGMTPHTDISPLNENQLYSHQLVYDIIYTPIETKFLKLAKQKKCKTLNGLGMFLGQASLQLKLWTGLELSQDEMKKHFDGDFIKP